VHLLKLHMVLLKYKNWVIITLLLHICVYTKAQSSSFVAPTNICLNETIVLQNTSTNAASYLWDFCHDGLGNQPTIQSAYIADASNIPEGMEVVNDNGIWYGFYFERSANSLYRLDFGYNITNTSPDVVNLGNIGSQFNMPTHIRMAKENSIWYGIVVNYNSSQIVILNFGNSLGTSSSNITTTNLGTLGLVNPRGLDVVQSVNGYILFASSWVDNGPLLLTRFANGLSAPPTNTRIISTGISKSLGLSLINDNGNWYGVVAGNGDGTITHFSFGSDLFNNSYTPVTISLTTLNNPTDVKIVKDGLNYFTFILTQGGLTEIEFGYSMVFSGADVINSLGNFNNLINNPFGISLVQDRANWRAFTIDQTSGNIYRLNFQDECNPGDITFDTLSLSNPIGVFFRKAGEYEVDLIAYNSSGGFNMIGQAITVNSLVVPSISLSNNNNCINIVNEFNVNAVDGSIISSSSWSFGDGNMSSSNPATNRFQYTGSYNVNVAVTASNGCQNIAYDTIQIFNPPKASFTLPNASPFCSNQNYVYSNNSTYDNGSNPTWQWSVNGANVTTTQDLTYLFPTTSTQNITLTASIPGCSSDSTQTVSTLVDGPLVSFTSPTTGCQDNTVSFVNITSSSTTSLSWSFGDGNTSIQSNTTNSYSSTGTFPVTLNVGNANGCQNYLTKNILIYSVPQPNFAIEAPPLSCANSLAQFDNNTPALTDSNITSWAWNFGDAANGTSTQKNPAYIFSSAANYNISLTATSNFGCTATAQKSIVISPSPQAAFNFSPACVNQNTQFTDASTGTVTSYQWNIQNNTFTTRNPQYIFNASGNYPVTFNVTASNNCRSQLVKTINVPIPPTVDFSTQAPCTNNATKFQELYPNGNDPTITWSWNFGQGSGTGSPTSHQFLAEGTYTITLNTTRQSGCVYSASKNISISTGPTADFTPSVEAGAAPLNVTFNNSSSATSYLWNFGDTNNSTSTLTSPTFTYAALGSYKALLTASNSLGCSDTLSAWIDVVIPHIDLVMNNFSLLNNSSSNSSEVIVTISNAGNIPMTNPEIDIDLGGNATVKENLTGTIRPGKSYQQTLNLGIVTQYLKYICVDIDAENDVDLANNKLCETLSGIDVVQTPYPNPAKEQIHFDWISSSQENVRVVIYTSTGEIVFEQTFDSVQEGLNQLSINTSSLSNGLYLIQFNGSKTSKTFKIAITND